jgi:hypothetical protein
LLIHKSWNNFISTNLTLRLRDEFFSSFYFQYISFWQKPNANVIVLISYWKKENIFFFCWGRRIRRELLENIIHCSWIFIYSFQSLRRIAENLVKNLIFSLILSVFCSLCNLNFCYNVLKWTFLLTKHQKSSLSDAWKVCGY